VNICLYLSPFLRYSTSINGVLLKSGLESLEFIGNGTSREIAYKIAFHGNYGLLLVSYRRLLV